MSARLDTLAKEILTEVFKHLLDAEYCVHQRAEPWDLDQPLSQTFRFLTFVFAFSILAVNKTTNAVGRYIFDTNKFALVPFDSKYELNAFSTIAPVLNVTLKSIGLKSFCLRIAARKGSAMGVILSKDLQFYMLFQNTRLYNFAIRTDGSWAISSIHIDFAHIPVGLRGKLVEQLERCLKMLRKMETYPVVTFQEAGGEYAARISDALSRATQQFSSSESLRQLGSHLADGRNLYRKGKYIEAISNFNFVYITVYILRNGGGHLLLRANDGNDSLFGVLQASAICHTAKTIARQGQTTTALALGERIQSLIGNQLSIPSSLRTSAQRSWWDMLAETMEEIGHPDQAYHVWKTVEDKINGETLAERAAMMKKHYAVKLRIKMLEKNKRKTEV